MDYFVWSTSILTAWAALGPLLGVRYGQVLTRRWQRQHWINDNAKQECRELISTMADTFSVYLEYYTQSNVPGLDLSGQILQRDRALKASREIFFSRLFISDQLLKFKIRERWIGALTEYEKSRDEKKFVKEYGTLIAEVRGMAQDFIA